MVGSAAATWQAPSLPEAISPWARSGDRKASLSNAFGELLGPDDLRFMPGQGEGGSRSCAGSSGRSGGVTSVAGGGLPGGVRSALPGRLTDEGHGDPRPAEAGPPGAAVLAPTGCEAGGRGSRQAPGGGLVLGRRARAKAA